MAANKTLTKYLDILEETGTLNGEQLKALHADLLDMDGRDPVDNAVPPSTEADAPYAATTAAKPEPEKKAAKK